MRRALIALCLTAAPAVAADEQPAPPRCPPGVARWARPSESKYDIGYYVGGGVGPRHGDPPCRDEGTWGWDYGGLLPKRVALWWSHGRREQGGLGAYRTVGFTVREHSSP